MMMQCKCGREARRHEKKTPEGMYKKYVRVECVCGITTPWCYSESPTVNEYLREEWEKTQGEKSEISGQMSVSAENKTLALRRTSFAQGDVRTSEENQ